MKQILLSIKQVFNTAGIYIFLWCFVMFTQRELLVVPYLGQVSLIIALLFSIYAFFKVWNIKTIPFLQGAKLMVVLFTFYGIFLMIDTPVIHVAFNHQDNPSYWFLEGVYKSILPIFAFFYLTIKGKLTMNNLQIWVILFVAQAYVLYMSAYQDMYKFQDNFESTNLVNSLAYLFIAMIPGVPLFKKQYLQYAIFALCLIMVILAMKRGAILAGTLSLFWFVYKQTKSYAHKRSVTRILLMVVLLYALLYGIVYVYNTTLIDNVFFQDRLEATLAGGSSGRNEISQHFRDYYLLDMSFLEKIIGIGAYGTIRTYKNFAHNDWIEILICEGIVGITCYLYYWVNVYKTLKICKKNYTIYMILSLFAIIQFAKTFFSMSIDDMLIYTTAPVGYALGQLYLNNREGKINKIVNNFSV